MLYEQRRRDSEFLTQALDRLRGGVTLSLSLSQGILHLLCTPVHAHRIHHALAFHSPCVEALDLLRGGVTLKL